MEPTSGSDRSSVDLALLLVRLIGGGIIAVHGAQKLFPLFGGPKLDGLVQSQGPVGYLVAIGEFFGGLGLVLGILSRFSAASNIVIMLGAIFLVHGKNGFFSPGGFEYNLALIGLFLPILIAGPGRHTLARPLPFLGHSGEPPHQAIE
ncbi:DoxX family protein [bacterium]|nr:MAG: DoxX family protein [bacterium]